MKLAFVVCALSVSLYAAEGKWTPDQILKLDPAMLKAQGLELPPSRLWDPATGQGLLSAVISTGGCSASFISPNGLFITNHHCLFGIIQEHSTAKNDLITNGFLAKGEGEELKGKAVRITLPHRFTDVSKEVTAAVPAGATDAQRYRAIEAKQLQLVTDCEKQAGHRCRAAAFDGGVQYILIDSIEFSDIRLVYAPPRSVGEFGGEIDNFAWPRHTGDFAIGRVYRDGAPFKPAFYFPISKTGVKPGDLVMVMGYPGTTYRALTVAEMAERRDLFFARRVDLFGEYIRVLETRAKDSPTAAIAVATMVKTLNNVYKNAEGQLEGFRRGHILEKQEVSEQEVLAWAKQHAEFKNAVEARDGLKSMIEEQRKSWDRDFLISNLQTGSRALYFAATVARVALEKTKPNAEREAEYQDRELPRLRDRLEREQSNLYVPADKELLAIWIKRRGGNPDRVEQMYAGTKVLDPAERRKMFEETPDQLRARRDPFLDYALEIAQEQQALQKRRDEWNGTVARLRPVWRRAVMAHAGKPVAPDANSTLRLSFAQVRGYEPRDSVIYKPQTTLTGMLEKFTGKDPFEAPEDLLAVARKSDFGPWADPLLKDVPVDFLADADTTGGNSGSPMINGRGELVGVNFDRVWENVANDFGYNPAVARNVSVDVRYLLWILDRVKHGDWLLKELGIENHAK